jgi:uncharacterized protein YjiK
MHLFFCIALTGFFSLPGLCQTLNFQELELKSVHVLEKYDQIFDLSGIAKVGHKYYVISDKAHNTSLYQINLHKKSFQITDSISLQYDQNADIEAIDYCENFSWFFTNEQTNQAYVSDLKGHNKLLFDCKQLNSTFDWGSNKGLEGIAVDCTNKMLYLAKEREPRFVISFDMDRNTVVGINMRDSLGDISDLKFESGFLYILERNQNLITKMDVSKMQVVNKVSYKETCSHPEGKFYKGTPYGMAEALLLTPDEIWLGLDNNSLYFSDFATSTYGLTGNRPVILKFKRPEGF